MIESGERYATLETALKIERLSQGSVPARQLLPPDKRHLLPAAGAEARP